MNSNIEINAPAFIQTRARHAIDSLDRGDLNEVREILTDMARMSSQFVEWLRLLAESGHNLPTDKTWTKFIHRKEEP